MRLTGVTITGADDGIKLEDLIPLSHKYPFVEWAILFSTKRQGTPRYPSGEWLRHFHGTMNWIWHDPHPTVLRCAAHACGDVARMLMSSGGWYGDPVPCGNWMQTWSHAFRRVQINGFCLADVGDRFETMVDAWQHTEFILQAPSSLHLMQAAVMRRKHPNVSALYDPSGGRGQAQEGWPTPVKDMRVGYAGGIGPDNVLKVIEAIDRLDADGTYWIDMESGVRTDERFDLGKVEAVLSYAAPYVFDR
jgi:hypothetical protein